MLGQVRNCCAIAIAVSLIAAPTGAPAADPAAVRPAASAPAPSGQASPWLTLSAMTSTSPLDSETAAALQPHAASLASLAPLAPLSVILSTFAMTIWTMRNESHGYIRLEPISP